MRVHYLAAAKTDMGLVKQVNQDSLTVKVADTELGEVALAVICDGMGGLTKGELASAMVVKAFEKWFYDQLPYKLKGLKADMLQREWEKLIADCNTSIREQGSQSMGTTLTAMLLYAGNYYIIHVGDCRIYELAEKIVQLTKDQTFIAREMELGRMTKEQARNDSRRNVLLQCIGVKESVEPQFLTGRMIPGACYLLCSDGFRHEISRQEILETVKAQAWEQIREQKSYQEIMTGMNKVLDELIIRGKKRGEMDNISAILVQTLEEMQSC